MDPLEGEGRMSVGADEALHALAVMALDAAKPTGGLPRERVFGDVLVQEAVGAEVAEDAVPECGLQPLPVMWP